MTGNGIELDTLPLRQFQYQKDMTQMHLLQKLAAILDDLLIAQMNGRNIECDVQRSVIIVPMPRQIFRHLRH